MVLFVIANSDRRCDRHISHFVPTTEAQLDQARSKQGYAQRQVDEAQQRLRESWGQPEEEPQPVAVAQPEIIEEPAMAAAAPEPTAAPTPPQEPPASEPSAPTKGITIVYETGWDNAFVHYNADDKGMMLVCTFCDVIHT